MNPVRPLLIAALGLFAAQARAQAVPPFFTPGATAFSPEISVVNTGTLNDVQATVSADRKYVTLTMRPQMSELISLQNFAINGPPPLGFVGGVSFNANSGSLGAMNPAFALAPGRGAALLAQRGMTPIRSR
jgi:hypothetical protein